MPKSLKILTTLFVIFVATYMGSHYWIRARNTVDDDVTKVSRLVACEPNEIRALSLTRAGELLEFERVDHAKAGVPLVTAYAEAEWRFVKPFQGEADATLLRRITSTICELYDPILIRPSEFKPGDKTPGTATELIAHSSRPGEEYRVEFGAAGSDRLQYVKSKEGDKGERIAKIPTQLRDSASVPAVNFRNLQVMRMGADNVQLATLKIDGKERFSLERAGADWRVMLGGKEKGPGSADAGKFLYRIASLRALEVTEAVYSSGDCRKGRAKAVLELYGVASREETIFFDYGKGGDIAVCSTGRSMRFRVHRDLIKFLDVQPKALM